jgi:flagellar capping protein FliD
LEELTIEEITKQVKNLRKVIDSSIAKKDVYEQNIKDIKLEFKSLEAKCIENYQCVPSKLSELYNAKYSEMNELLQQANIEYQKLTNQNDD